MKTYTRLVGLLYLFATSNLAEAMDLTFIACTSKCVAIDRERNVAIPLGYASGESERDVAEAFALMGQDCRNQSEDAGYGDSNLLVNEIESSSASATSSSESHSILDAQSKRSFKRKTELHAESRAANSSEAQQSSYDGRTVGFEACQVLHRNPNAKPQYTGPGRPLG